MWGIEKRSAPGAGCSKLPLNLTVRYFNPPLNPNGLLVNATVKSVAQSKLTLPLSNASVNC